jgi:hypothetical protein
MAVRKAALIPHTKLIAFVTGTGCLLHGPNRIYKPISGYLVSYGLSPRRTGFEPSSVNVRFVVDEVTLG